MRRLLPPLLLTLLSGLPLSAADLKLPELLMLSNGKKVETVETWQKERRPEILELFWTHVYGRAPIGRPQQMNFDVFETTPDAMDGTATRKQVRITYRGPGGEGAIKLVLFTPNNVGKPAPCFLLICNRPAATNIDPERKNKSPFWPAEQIVTRGYAAAAFYNGDVDPDKHDGFKDGVHGIFDPASGRKADSWGTIAAWAWGASRVLDYLVTDPAIHAGKIGVVGHSRGGKTALWAGAEDERFAMVVSNCSGNSGAMLARRRQPKAESVERINKSFPHWFNDNYKQYGGREDELPVDQHMLAALIAPRLLYIASKTEDLWADPEGEFLTAVHAGPAYQLYGHTGLASTTFPAPENPVHGGRIGYHLQTGKHDLTEYDWQRYMDFADQHWKPVVAK